MGATHLPNTSPACSIFSHRGARTGLVSQQDEVVTGGVPGVRCLAQCTEFLVVVIQYPQRTYNWLPGGQLQTQPRQLCYVLPLCSWSLGDTELCSWISMGLDRKSLYLGG